MRTRASKIRHWLAGVVALGLVVGCAEQPAPPRKSRKKAPAAAQDKREAPAAKPAAKPTNRATTAAKPAPARPDGDAPKAGENRVE